MVVQAQPNTAPALHLLALIAYRQGNLPKAIDLLRATLQADPNSAEIHNDLGNLLQMSGALDEAVGCYEKALRLRPEYAEGYRNLASALRRLGRLEEAKAALESAVAHHPGYGEAIAQLVVLSKQLCDWRRIDSLTASLAETVAAGSAPVNPFIFLSLDTTPDQQLQCAHQYASAHFPVEPRRAHPPTQRSEKLTLGYLSADFQEHATAQLIAELFLLHDRSRFRVIGYSYGKDDGSAARRNLAESFDAFVDLETATHAAAAQRIRDDGVDILIDLKGYTAEARPQIAALRPAPIQVHYLGYPGTMGSGAIDYILADPFVVPPELEPHFSECVVRLPDCYQINDRRRPIAALPARAECGLPETGVVFCCFNTASKLTAPMFDIWIRLVGSVPGSVLWLLDPGPAAAANLRREADARLAGGSSRLVFAPSLPNPRHLARFAVADMFLDTLPYNAHTLTSDALWGGCPVVTCPGSTFASRVAGSILHAAGLPELVTATLSEYEALALQLARDQDFRETIRAKVRASRIASPLFDTARLTRHIEAAYETMWRLHQSGASPRAFTVE